MTSTASLMQRTHAPKPIAWGTSHQPVRPLKRRHCLVCTAEDSNFQGQLQDKAKAAGKFTSRKLRETYTVVDKGVKQAAQGANSRFDFTGKAQATAQAVRHQASNANKRWNLSSKARHVREDAARALPKAEADPKQHQLAAYGSPRSALSAATAGAFWAGMELNQLSREGRSRDLSSVIGPCSRQPIRALLIAAAEQWKKRYDSFSRTPLGKLAWTAFLVWGFYSGLFFRMLNILFLLWWIAPIVLVPLAQRANRQAVKNMQAQQQRQQEAASVNTLWDALMRQQAFQQQAAAGRRRTSQSAQSSSRKKPPSDDGVIDVEYTTIDVDPST